MSADSQIIRFSVGRGSNLAKAKNKALPWGVFLKQFENPVRTGERFKEYLKMPVDEQVALKGTNGWIFRTQIDGERRNRASGKPSDLITLDLDYATPELVEKILAGEILPGFAFLAHSTRRHTDEKPRIRVFVPVKTAIENESYGAVSRIFCQTEIDPQMVMVDPVSFRPAQMMFKPTASKDGDWFFHSQEGEVFDWEQMLEVFEMLVGDWRDIRTLPAAENEKLRERAEKAENPQDKKGPVGDFCRAYTVPEAIEKFLPDVYEPVDDHSRKPRYTYLGGTTRNGAVVEDDGLFLYSHHGSDPCADQLVNAFDLVRIHLFGKEDTDDDLPMGKRPSYQSMVEFIADDPLYRDAAVASRYDISAMFDDIMDPDEVESEDESEDETPDDSADGSGPSRVGSGLADQEPAARKDKPKREKPPKKWMNQLEFTQDGLIKMTLPNLILIVRYDPRFFARIAQNEFTGQVVLRRSIVPKISSAPPLYVRDEVNGERWQDEHDVTVRAVIEGEAGEGKSGYGLRVPVRDLMDAIMGAARYHKFHPIRDMLDGLVWDGKSRIERMGVDYLGCPDSPYYREIFRLKMVASVARIYEPGHKFDNAIIIEGAQGIGKSTFIKILYGAQYFCEVDCDLDDRARVVELISGKWGGELPELGSLHKSDFNAAKMFMRRQHDDVRLAYARRTTEHPRQTVFWGTTNDTKYLKDPTGNRSFWPVKAEVEKIDLPRLRNERLQLWAEAVVLYRAMREEQTYADLDLDLSDEAKAEAGQRQEGARPQELSEEWAGRIRDWAEEPVLLMHLLAQYGVTTEKFGTPDGLDPETTWVRRTVWRQDDILEHALGLRPALTNFIQKQMVEKTYSLLTEWRRVGAQACRRFGIRARWHGKIGTSELDLIRGYEVVDPEVEDLI